MKILGYVLFFSGIGLVIGNYDDKKRFMQKDYTEKDIENYQKILAVGCAIVCIGFVMFFA